MSCFALGRETSVDGLKFLAGLEKIEGKVSVTQVGKREIYRLEFHVMAQTVYLVTTTCHKQRVSPAHVRTVYVRLENDMHERVAKRDLLLPLTISAVTGALRSKSVAIMVAKTVNFIFK